MAAITIAKANTHTLKVLNIEESTSHGLKTTLGEGVRAAEFIEEAPRPTDAFYFPLDTDARGYAPGDSLPTIEPTIATNLAFDEDGVWVGTALTNLWPLKTGNQGWIGSTVVNSLRSFVGDLKQTLTKAGGATNAHSSLQLENSFIPVNNSWYTVSSYYRQLSGILTSPATFALSKTNGGTAIGRTNASSVIPAIKEQWQRGWGSAFYTELVLNAWPWISWTAATAMQARVCGGMVEKKPFVSAYCLSSRSAGALAFNLHASIGLNWDEDYTICYWKKMHGTSSDEVDNGYSSDSLGRNSNTVGGGYRWWGKNPTSFNFGFSGNGATFVKADMQYRWVFIALRRVDGILTLRTYGMGTAGLSSTQDVDDSFAGPDRYVTQNNYDLQLGGWDAANPCNAYYKDLIVLKRALSNQEIDYMYATKLKMYADAITIGAIQEGVL